MGAAAIATSAIARNRSTRAPIPCEVTASGGAGGAGIRAPARFPGALAFARVAYPIDDEAFFANPAFNRATHSFFRTTVVESVGTTYEGLSEHTY